MILFVDSFAEARLGGEGTLDLAARATSALADAYVRRRDRVGLIGFGGILRWLVPGSGIVQLYRIVDSLLDTQIVLSYYWKEIDVIPRRTLLQCARDRALTASRPALRRRSVDLRARGHDLAVIDISPVPFTNRPSGGLDAIAYERRCSATPFVTASQHRRRGRGVGQRAARCRPFSRRCGHSGLAGTRAADHCTRRAARARRRLRLRGYDRGRFAPIAS